MKEKIIEGAKTATKWSKSNHASSIVAGLGCGLTALLLYIGQSQLMAFMAGSAIILLGVPIANAIN